jgi:serine protease inhibitor ecotin
MRKGWAFLDSLLVLLQIPVVVYVPEGVEVRYWIWSATPDAKAIEKG